jgi:hypothetical protein
VSLPGRHTQWAPEHPVLIRCLRVGAERNEPLRTESSSLASGRTEGSKSFGRVIPSSNNAPGRLLSRSGRRLRSAAGVAIARERAAAGDSTQRPSEASVELDQMGVPGRRGPVSGVGGSDSETRHDIPE